MGGLLALGEKPLKRSISSVHISIYPGFQVKTMIAIKERANNMQPVSIALRGDETGFPVFRKTSPADLEPF